MMFEKKKYQMHDFKMAYGEKPIVEHGQTTSNGKLSWNDSAILTKLIKECGRLCDRFASDLFFDWTGVIKMLDEMNARWNQLTSYEIEQSDEFPMERSYLFGIRENGVDSAYSIFTKYEQAAVYNNRYGVGYRDIYRLDFRMEKNCDFTASLYRVDKGVG